MEVSLSRNSTSSDVALTLSLLPYNDCYPVPVCEKAGDIYGQGNVPSYTAGQGDY